MDSFFGIGAPELILILVIAGIVMGPERIGRTARWLGRTSAQLQSISRAFIRQLNAELDGGGESSEIKEAWNDMQDLRRQLEDLKQELMTVTKAGLNESTHVLKETQRELERTIAPPAMLSELQNSSESDSKAKPEIKPQESEPSYIPTELPKRIAVADDPE